MVAPSDLGKRKCADASLDYTCQACRASSSKGRAGTGSWEGLWFCDACWQQWTHPAKTFEAHGLPIMTYHEFRTKVAAGAQWVIIDGTVVDVELLCAKGDTLHKGGGDVLRRAIGEDLTGYYIYYHANTPRIRSLHKPGLSHMEHVREKIVKYAVGILDTHVHRAPLTSAEHRFWVEMPEKSPYYEHSATSFGARGVDSRVILNDVFQGVPQHGPALRAFWTVVGCLIGDAAAQPTHWNYKQSYFHEELRKRDRFDNPEFLRPSLNTYYHLPMGAQSCYGDQALEVLKSIVERGGLDPFGVVKNFAERFSEDGEYGPLPSEGLYNGSKQSVRELPIKGPWRHISLAGFVRKIQSGIQFPECGTDDAQADCFVRVVPVAALYAGHPDLLVKVEEVVRVTQDNPAAVAVAQAFALVLEVIIMRGSDGLTAINAAIDEFSRRAKLWELNGFCGRVADTMRSCVSLSGHTISDAILHFGEGSYSTSIVS